MKETTLTLVRTRSLADQVADSIVEGIAAGILAPGQKVVEAELAKQLQVSRVPVREALKILEAQGIVVSRPHRGVQVASFDDRKTEQIYEVRVGLERIAARDACERHHGMPALLIRLDGILEEMEHCLRRGDLMGVSKADLRFHHEICLASGNEIVVTLWEALSRHMLIVFELELQGDAERAHIVDHHRALRRALERGSPPEVEAEIQRHIMRLQGERASAARGAASGRSARV